jgi:hypothetical protein
LVLVGLEQVVLAEAHHDHAQVKGISMDGGMVHLRDEGWKEMKVGAVYDVALRWQRDARTAEWVEQAQAVNLSYMAVLGDVQAFAPALWQIAVQRQVPQAADSSVTADGAEWIWSVATDYFPDSTQIVDWYHARQHLWAAAHALFPDHPDRAQGWASHQSQALFLGALDQIIDPLDQTGLAEHSHYFRLHRQRMRYQEFRENGYPIGSGTVESGVKQFKARLTGPGMRWSRPAAQQMLVIRAAVLEHSFDCLWQRAA